MKFREVEISIIMATYNRAHLIIDALSSIQNQSFTNWECLIIDDGSEDGTANVVKEFTKRDSRFIYNKRLSEYKKGLPGCRNQGIDNAKGEFVIFFDDDDFVHPENLNYCYNLLHDTSFHFIRYDKMPFRKTPEIKSVNNLKNLRTELISLKDIDKVVTGELPFASCSVMWKKQCFSQNKFNENLMYAEEWECYTRILAEAKTGISIDEILYYNRKHSKSNTGEYSGKNPIRIRSYLKAAHLVLNNLHNHKLINRRLKKFFVRLGFELKSYSLISKSLEFTNAGKSEKMKYRLGYLIYPLLKPMFYLKSKT